MEELEVKPDRGDEAAEEPVPVEEISAEELVEEAPAGGGEDAEWKAIIEAAIYITDEPLTAAQIAAALGQTAERVNRLLDELSAEYSRPERGLSIREIAGGYKLATKPEHHEAIRSFVKNLKPPLKLSLPALETLAVIAYKQPVTAPEIMEIRGVQGVGVLKTLLDRKLIAAAGRKQVVGKPILYKTTKEFLVQFGLKDLTELPTLKEFEELGRLALTDADEPVVPALQADTSAAARQQTSEPGGADESAGARDESAAGSGEAPEPPGAPDASDQDPSKEPEPIKEPEPEPPPVTDPIPPEEPVPPTDPQHEPVKGQEPGGEPEPR